MDEPSTTQSDAPSRSPIRALPDRLIVALRFRTSRLGVETRAFARCLEDTVFPDKKRTGASEVILRVDAADRSLHLASPGRPLEEVCHRLPRMSRFLDGLHIREVVLDADLEWNQITDVLETLWLLRRPLRTGREGFTCRLFGRTDLRRDLISEGGLHVACTEARLDVEQQALTVRNSYCQLLFSRAISAYKGRASRFKDHRAFFRMAPRLALLVAVVTTLPALLYALFGVSPHVLAWLSVGLALLVAAGVYMVFQVIASEEYDKEHQSREIERRHRSLTAAYDKISRDLQTARDIQRQLLPGPSVQVMPARVHFAATFVPEMEVGGDYYDFRRLDDDRVAVMAADVSGHGMSAAFITGLIKSAFEYSRHVAESPTRFMAELNEVLCRLTPDDSFAAVVFGIYDARARTFRWCNAGHGPAPFAVRADGAIDALAEPIDLLAGVDGETAYREGETALQPGDKLVLFTDGVPDSVSAHGDRLGVDALLDVLRAHAGDDAERLRDAVIARVNEHTHGAPQFDDITLVAMEVVA